MDEKKASPSKTMQGIVYLIIIVALVSCSVAMCTGEKYSYVTPKNTLERQVEEIVIDKLGKTANWTNWEGNKQRVIKIEKTLQYDGGYLITIDYRADEHLTVDLIKDSLFYDAKKILPEIFQLSEVKVVMLKPYLLLTDSYGKQFERQVAKLVIDRNVAAKIDWENIPLDYLENIFQTEGELWLHNALR